MTIEFLDEPKTTKRAQKTESGRGMTLGGAVDAAVDKTRKLATAPLRLELAALQGVVRPLSAAAHTAARITHTERKQPYGLDIIDKAVDRAIGVLGGESAATSVGRFAGETGLLMGVTGGVGTAAKAIPAVTKLSQAVEGAVSVLPKPAVAVAKIAKTAAAGGLTGFGYGELTTGDFDKAVEHAMNFAVGGAALHGAGTAMGAAIKTPTGKAITDALTHYITSDEARLESIPVVGGRFRDWKGNLRNIGQKAENVVMHGLMPDMPVMDEAGNIINKDMRPAVRIARKALKDKQTGSNVLKDIGLDNLEDLAAKKAHVESAAEQLEKYKNRVAAADDLLAQRREAFNAAKMELQVARRTYSAPEVKDAQQGLAYLQEKQKAVEIASQKLREAAKQRSEIKFYKSGLAPDPVKTDEAIKLFNQAYDTLEPENRAIVDSAVQHIQDAYKWGLEYGRKMGFFGDTDVENMISAGGEKHISHMRDFGNSVLGNPFARRTKTGSDAPIQNVWDTTERYVKAIIVKAEQNKFQNMAIDAVKHMDGIASETKLDAPQKVVPMRSATPAADENALNSDALRNTMIPPTETPVVTADRAVTRRLRLEPDEILTKRLERIHTAEGPKTRSVWVITKFKDKMMKEAVDTTPPELVQKMIRFAEAAKINWFRSVFQTTTTSFINFMTKNPIRDLGYRNTTDPRIRANPLLLLKDTVDQITGTARAALKLSNAERLSFGVLRGVMNGIVNISDDELAYIIQHGGGAGSYFSELAQARLGEKFNEVMGRGIIGTIKTLNPIEYMEKIGMALENATRLDASLKVMRELTPDNAFWKSKEVGRVFRKVTADFGDMGIATKVIGKIIPFYSSSIAGSREFFNALAKHGDAVIWKGIQRVTIPTLINWWRWKDDPRYKAIPQYVHNMYHIVSLDHNIKMPKSWELDTMFSTLPLAAVRAAYEHNPKVVSEAMQSLSQLIPNPTQHPIPQTIRDISKNQSEFTGRPIEPEGTEFLPAHMRVSKYTSMTTQQIAKRLRKYTDRDMLQISPADMDYIITRLFPGWGQFALDTSDTVVGVATDKKFVKPARPVAQTIPGVQPFYLPNYMNAPNSALINMIYELKQESDGIRKAYKEKLRRHEKDASEFRRINAKHFGEYHDRLNAASRVIADCNKRARDIILATNHLEMSAKQKQKRLEDIYAVANRAAIKQLEKINKDIR